MNCTLFNKITVAVAALVVLSSCGGPKRKPGRTYMPDMAYSRAYESYPDLDTNIFTASAGQAGNKIYYDRLPVPGTVKRGTDMIYHGINDSMGRVGSRIVMNPVPDTLMTTGDKSESERLYNIYCGICHGTKMDGQGPLSAGGKLSSTPANLNDLTKFGRAIYPDGEMFHTITYGKNTMGSYASQLNTRQRWMVVNYIRSKQPVPKPETPAGGTGTPPTGVDTLKKANGK